MKKFLSLVLTLIMVLSVAPVAIFAVGDNAEAGTIDFAANDYPLIDGVREASWGVADLTNSAFRGNTLKLWARYTDRMIYIFAELHCPNGYVANTGSNGNDFNFVGVRLDLTSDNSIWQGNDGAIGNIWLNSDGTVGSTAGYPIEKGFKAGQLSADGKVASFEFAVYRHLLPAALPANTQVWGAYVQALDTATGKWSAAGATMGTLKIAPKVVPTYELAKPDTPIVPDGDITAAEWGSTPAYTHASPTGNVSFWFRQGNGGMWVAAQSVSTVPTSGMRAQVGLVWRAVSGFSYKGAYTVLFNGWTTGAAHGSANMPNSNIRGASYSGDTVSLEIFLTYAEMGITTTPQAGGSFQPFIQWTEQWYPTSEATAATPFFMQPNGSILPGGVMVNCGSSWDGVITFTLPEDEADEDSYVPSASGAPSAAPTPDAAPVETPAADAPSKKYGPAPVPVPAPSQSAIRGPKTKF